MVHTPSYYSLLFILLLHFCSRYCVVAVNCMFVSNSTLCLSDKVACNINNTSTLIQWICGADWCRKLHLAAHKVVFARKICSWLRADNMERDRFISAIIVQQRLNWRRLTWPSPCLRWRRNRQAVTLRTASWSVTMLTQGEFLFLWQSAIFKDGKSCNDFSRLGCEARGSDRLLAD